MLGSIATGMNLSMGVQAKSVLVWGLGNAYLEKPPAGVLLLSATSWLLGLVPGRALYAAVLASHVLWALAFWCWVRSLRLGPRVFRASLLLFLGLPLFNSYEGLDNYATLIAAALFLLLASQFLECRVAGARPGGLVLASLAAWGLLLVRVEYLLFLPGYLALDTLLRWLAGGGLPGRGERRLYWAAACFLVLGGLTTMTFRYYDAGDFALAPNAYTCATFLQGTPEAWLTAEEYRQGDKGRYLCGVRHFGDPADYGYSLPRLVWDNPGRTCAKAIHNLPSWLFHLGRRHVVCPLPVAGLACVGAVAFAARGGRRRQRVLPSLAATILMTLPLIGSSVSAEYLMPAYAAMVVLAANGFQRLLSLIGLGGGAGAGGAIRAARGAAWLGLLALLEMLYFRGGGNLPDATDLAAVAEVVDGQAADAPGERLLLDPYSMDVDIFSRADIRNRWLELAWLRAQGSPATFPPESMPGLLEIERAPIARAAGLDRLIVWCLGDGLGGDCQRRVASWQERGFRPGDSRIVRDRHGRTVTVVFLRRDRSAAAAPPGEGVRTRWSGPPPS